MLAIVIITVVTVVVSCLCSLTEAAFYSIPPSKIEQMRKAGSRNGERLARLRAHVDEPIAAILTLNTVANTVGASVAAGLVAAIYGSKWAGVYGGVMTLLILFLGELLPKTIGVTYAPRVAPFFSGPLLAAIFLLKPFIVVVKLLTRLVRRGHEGENAPSEEEILALAEMGARAGTLLPDEARWAINAMRLNDVTARDLMTPRIVVYLLPADLPLAMVKLHSTHWSFSRLPVVRNNDPDQVEGVVHRREVFDELVNRPSEDLKNRRLRDLMHEPFFVPETIRCNELLKMFLKNRQHLAIVTNEFGGMEGVIALEDVLEFLLGEEIVDPHDKHVDMQEAARRLAERRMQRLRERLHDEAPPPV